MLFRGWTHEELGKEGSARSEYLTRKPNRQIDEFRSTGFVAIADPAELGSEIREHRVCLPPTESDDLLQDGGLGDVSRHRLDIRQPERLDALQVYADHAPIRAYRRRGDLQPPTWPRPEIDDAITASKEMLTLL